MLEAANIIMQCDYDRCTTRQDMYQSLNGSTEVDLALAEQSLCDAGWLVRDDVHICPLHIQSYEDSLDDDDLALTIAADNASR